MPPDVERAGRKAEVDGRLLHTEERPVAGASASRGWGIE
jgi:hypothetical protein